MALVSLDEAYLRKNKEREMLIEKMGDTAQKKLYIPFFSLADELKATYFIYKEGNIEKAKNEYYEAANATLYCVENLNTDPYAILRFCLYAILSDDNKIIRRYFKHKSLQTSENLGTFAFHYGNAIKAVLADNKEALEKSIEGMTKRSRSGLFKKFNAIPAVFNGILKSDRSVVESALVDLVKKSKSQQPGIIKDYMHIEATGLAKIAWRIGIEVKVDSTFIPLALLPTKELPHYESFDFFNE